MAVFFYFFPKQIEQDEKADGEKCRTHRSGKEHRKVLVGDTECPPEVCFNNAGQNHGQ